MNSEGVQMRCTGYFQENLSDLERIKEVMEEIEQGNIRRPVFELAFPTYRQMPPVCAAALFREGAPVFVEGWFLWHVLRGSADNVVYCVKKEPKEGDAEYKEVLRCGVLEVIHTSAILSRNQAGDLLISLAKGEPVRGFEQRSYQSVFWPEEIN